MNECITKSGSHSNNPWYTSYLQAFKSFRRHLERTYKRTRHPQLLSELKKPFSLPCTINLFLQSLISKSLVSASSIFLQLLTPSTTTHYLKDCPSGSVLLTRLSSGFSPIFLLVLSPSKHLKHHPNHALSPVVFRKVQFSGPYFSLYGTRAAVHARHWQR